MAAETSLAENEIEKFQSYSARLRKIVFQDNDEQRKTINLLLDDFNSVEYSLRAIGQEVAGDVLKNFCFLVPLSQEMLVTKVCQLIVNLVSRQKLVLDNNIEIVSEYIVRGLQQCQAWTFNDLLQALSALVYENSGKTSQFHALLVGKMGLLLQMVDSVDEDMQRSALHCMENLCARTTQGNYLSEEQQTTCWNVFLRLLHAPKPMRMDDVNHCRIVISCLRGLQNLLSGSKTIPLEQLGPLLAAVKVYMLHGMPNHRSIVPPTLYPTPAIHYDPQPAAQNAPSSATSNTAEKKEDKSTNLRPGAGKTPSKAAKKSKKRRSKAPVRERNDDEDDHALVSQMDSFNMSEGPSGDVPNRLVPSLLPTWANISGSESDFSDTEGGQTNKLRAYCSKVRLCSLGCFHAVVKITEKRVMFGYWTSFLPDTPALGGPAHTANLFTVITRDPSPRVRASALAVLTALLEGTRSYVAAAEDPDPSRQAFTPFSVTLGCMVKEMHRCLMLALVSESSPLAITQIIKCLATLVPNVPYQRLKLGLINRVVKQIKPFLAHRDPNIRVACLTCLGSIVSVQAPLVEVWQVLQQANRPPAPPRLSSSEALGEESGYITPSSLSAGDRGSLDSSGLTTPVLSSGAMTPTLSEQIFSTSANVSWVVRLAVKNINPHLMENSIAEGNPSKRSTSGSSSSQPLPVRLESLQLLAKLAKGYFTTIRDCLPLMCEVIQNCLEDKDPSVQLHGAKLLEEIGSMLLQNTKIEKEMLSPDAVDVAKTVEVWMTLLNGQLPKVLQGRNNHAARSTACNCLSNIGPLVFEKLPMPKRIMCITILLGLTSDEDHHVRAASVRALGVYVLYPCLREDVSFVTDAANSIINSLYENNIVVKIKAAWSLGNLSDALVLNKSNNDEAFLEDFTDEMLLKLFEITIAASEDSDKVKSNAVRALGNLLRYFPARCLGNIRFDALVTQGVKKLVKNVGTGTMKVRWNACYAMSNVFKNDVLPLGSAEWTDDVHNALATVVRNCKNFKVRINAAMAFSVPVKRENFGSTQTFTVIWDSLISGLQGSETVNDFMEFKYRDSLLEQACSTLLHLALVVSADDLRALSKILAPRRSIIQDYLIRFKTLKVSAQGETKPAHSAKTKAKEVGAYLKGLANQDLKEEQTVVIEMIQDILVNPVIGYTDDDSRPSSPKASFSQTYD